MSTATEMLDRYLAAEAAILNGQAIEFGGRRLTMADLAMVQKGRAEWERRCSSERNGGGFAVANLSGQNTREGREDRWGHDR